MLVDPDDPLVESDDPLVELDDPLLAPVAPGVIGLLVAEFDDVSELDVEAEDPNADCAMP